MDQNMHLRFSHLKYRKVFDKLTKFTGNRYKQPDKLVMFCIWFLHYLLFKKVKDEKTPFDIMLDTTFFTKRQALDEAEKDFQIFNTICEDEDSCFEVDIPLKKFKPLLNDLITVDKDKLVTDQDVLVHFCVWEAFLFFTKPEIKNKTGYDMLCEEWSAEVSHGKESEVMDFFYKEFDKFMSK
jgi:hypothetical protein